MYTRYRTWRWPYHAYHAYHVGIWVGICVGGGATGQPMVLAHQLAAPWLCVQESK